MAIEILGDAIAYGSQSIMDSFDAIQSLQPRTHLARDERQQLY